jgi:hypothetical protein
MKPKKNLDVKKFFARLGLFDNTLSNKEFFMKNKNILTFGILSAFVFVLSIATLTTSFSFKKETKKNKIIPINIDPIEIKTFVESADSQESDNSDGDSLNLIEKSKKFGYQQGYNAYIEQNSKTKITYTSNISKSLVLDEDAVSEGYVEGYHAAIKEEYCPRN